MSLQEHTTSVGARSSFDLDSGPAASFSRSSARGPTTLNRQGFVRWWLGAHRASSNLKTWLQGTHRGVDPRHLHVYLDEFVFRHNRRRTPMAAFQTLLGLGARHGPTTYREITGGRVAA